jgi:hypothetical protein
MYPDAWPQTIVQSHSNKNSMVLAQKQTWRQMKQNKRPRHKPIHLQPFDFWQRSPKYILEERQPFQQIVLGKLDTHL